VKLQHISDNIREYFSWLHSSLSGIVLSLETYLLLWESVFKRPWICWQKVKGCRVRGHCRD